MGLVLYSTAGCHLCELAEGLLEQQRQQKPELSWTVTDIADDDGLFERYGWLIPVLALGEQELRWPFDGEGLAAFIDEFAG